MHQDFVAALRPHYEDALRYCRALCARSASEEAEDVLQQALFHALNEFGTLHEPARFKGESRDELESEFTVLRCSVTGQQLASAPTNLCWRTPRKVPSDLADNRTRSQADLLRSWEGVGQ